LWPPDHQRALYQQRNHAAMMPIQYQKANEYQNNAIDQFGRLYADAEEVAR
jgi:hypothetical protein